MCLLPSPAVAVLIVNFKVYDALDRALASLATTLRPGDQVVVFDQVSEANRLARSIAAFPEVTFIASPENLGFAAGVNRAAARSTAPLLLLLNPDSVVSSMLLDNLAGFLDARPDVAVVGPRVLNEDGSVQASARRFPDLSTALAGRSTWLSTRFPNNWLTRHNLPARFAKHAVNVDWVAGSCLMTRRTLFDALGGLDEGFFMYWEDADYARRAAELGGACVYLPTTEVRHAGGLSAARNPASAIRAFHQSAFRMYWKHSGAAGRLAAPMVKLLLWARGEWLARRAR